MKRLLTILVGITLLITSSWGINYESNKKVLTIITSADNPPYEFVQYENIIGFDIDLIKIICDRLNKNYEIKNVPSDQLFSIIKSKQCDMAISGINSTQNASFGVIFSIPYLTNTKAIVMVNSGKFKNVSQGAYFPHQFLKNKTIGVKLGSQIESELYDLGIENLSIRYFTNLNELSSAIIKSSRHGEDLYGVIVNLQDAQSMVQQNKNLIFYKLKFGESFVIAFPKGSGLQTQVNRIITDLVDEGKISELESKWEILSE